MKKIFKGLGVFVLSAAMVGVFSLSVMAAQAPTGRKFKANGSINLDLGKHEFKATSADETWKGEPDDTDFETTVSFGFFLNEMFEIGPEINYASSKEEWTETEQAADVDYRESDKSTDEATLWSLGVKANAHFNMDGAVVPYVGLRLALASFSIEETYSGADYFNGQEVPGTSYNEVEMDDSDTSFLYGFQLGLDWFLTDHVSINPELRYTMGEFELNDPDGQKVDVDYQTTSFLVGIAVHF